ncbi:MAG TPA: glycosyltransferase [Pyrinomonadaceae bacterium]|jgi:processive 1,2-diacylglycerol beta-glucosyltransferase
MKHSINLSYCFILHPSAFILALKSMFRKVLVLSASAGAGHMRAADAVERAIVETGASLEVRHVDTLAYTNKLFRHLYSKAYLEMVNKTPEVLGWLYDHLDKPWKNERRRLALDKLNTRPFVRMLKEYQPEIIVCTHFLPAEIISWLRAKERITSRQAIVVTDFDVHAMWLCHHYEHYFVALEETRVHMEKLGIPKEKLTVSGIPIDPVFALEKDKRAMRDKHQLRQDVLTILLSAGGFGVGPMEHIIQSLTEMRGPVQVVALCGRNAELKERIEGLARGFAPGARVSIRPVGFTKEMDEYMSASDILLGKPGGLTTSEALAKGLVFVIVNPIPGQEERNSDHLLEDGVAIRCNNLPALAYKIDRLVADPSRFSAMQSNARRLARPNAAREIVSRLLTLKSKDEG